MTQPGLCRGRTYYYYYSYLILDCILLLPENEDGFYDGTFANDILLCVCIQRTEVSILQDGSLIVSDAGNTLFTSYIASCTYIDQSE